MTDDQIQQSFDKFEGGFLFCYDDENIESYSYKNLEEIQDPNVIEECPNGVLVSGSWQSLDEDLRRDLLDLYRTDPNFKSLFNLSTMKELIGNTRLIQIFNAIKNHELSELHLPWYVDVPVLLVAREFSLQLWGWDDEMTKHIIDLLT